MDLTWLAVHPVRHAVWFEWRFASVRLLRETVHRSWRLLQSASHCSHTHLHARRRTDTSTPMHSSTLRGFLVSAVPLKIIWRFAVGGEAGTRSTTGPTPSGPRSCSAGSWLSSGSRPWEKIGERKERKVSFSWSGQCLVGCQLNGSNPCPWLPTWWHAGRGRTASDPSANRWKLWFSGTRQCPALGAGTATGERERLSERANRCQIWKTMWLRTCWRVEGDFSYQVIRHSSIVGNSQDLCEEVGVAVSSDPQIHHLTGQNIWISVANKANLTPAS